MTATAADELPRGVPPSMVERITLILDAFPSAITRLTLEDITRITGLPRSSAHRILDQLVRLRWLEHGSTGYGLGSRAVGLGGSDRTHAAIRHAAAPLLHELALRTGMVVHLAVRSGAEVVYLDKVGGRFASVVPSRVGASAPGHCTALGKAMLAWLEPEAVDGLYPRTLGRRTERTIGSLGLFHRELDRVRRRGGLAFERGECFPRIACVATAVRGPDGPVASISLVGTDTTPLERVAPLAIDAARRVSGALLPESAPGQR
ncbi:IclR family transcriptional regulator [Saccharomonospora sp. NPDC006951]